MTSRDASSPIVVFPSRERVLIAGCIVVICTLAWAYLIHLHHQMSSATGSEMMTRMGMKMDAPWGAADFFFTFSMWAVMMVGMMSPSATPMLLVFAATHARREDRTAPTAVVAFGLGYMAVWAGFSALATVAQWALHQAALLSSTMAIASPRLAAVLLIAAGVYQLTPLKRACLKHCQSPVNFLMSHWREGTRGAFRMGLHHGIHCVGCCWALMCVLFAVGVMNLVWVAMLTVFILLEELGRQGALVARVGGVAMVGLGVLVLQGLTV